MGEVYRARDTRLDREVAVKVLSSQLSEDAGLRQRFEREAKAVSGLNHPHICALFDVGQQNGIDYLVMELLEGETLAGRLTRGALPVDQLLQLGVEIGDALDKAHRRGIVHRDLKPANIMLTRSGAKLLDFGVAKTALQPTLDALLTAAPTQTTPATQPGTIVGTFQYMSPEQVEGRDVDGRSDIFSFGAVLYEMVTGRRAFQGGSTLSVASAVLERNPEPIRTLAPSTPPAVERAISVCLAKDPEERWQTTRDLVRELKWIAGARSATDETPPTISPRGVRERVAWVAAAALALVATVAATGRWFAPGAPQPRPLMLLSVETSPGAIFDRFRGAQLAISPDGTRVVAAEYDEAGTWHLAVRRFDQSRFVPIPGTAGGLNPFFSPDGEWIAFAADGKLKKVAVQGGAPVTLCELRGQFAAGGSWGDDGTIVFSLNEGTTGLARIPSGGGTPTPLTQVRADQGGRYHVWPQVLSGSQAVLFTAYLGDPFTEGDDVKRQIDVAFPKTGEWKTVHSEGHFGRYLPSGHLVFMRGTTMWAAPFSIDRLAVAGEPQPVLEEVNDFDVSSNGIAVYVSSRQELSTPYGIWWLESSGRTTPLLTTPGIYESPHLSPDGKRLAFEKADSWSRADIWVKDLERGTESRLTRPPGRHNTPRWAPDGQSIVFDSNTRRDAGLYCVRADGAGEAQRLTEGESSYWTAGSFSPDGKRLAFFQQNEQGSQVWTAPFEGDRDHPRLGKAEVFSRSAASEESPVFSPGGNWIAYSSKETGTAEVYVRPFPGPGGKSQISTGGGTHPIWSRTERKLYFLTPDWRIMVVGYAADASGFDAAKPQLWSEKKLAFLGGCYPYDLAPDGKRFAVVLNPDTANEQARKPTDHVMVIPGFFDELRRKALKTTN